MADTCKNRHGDYRYYRGRLVRVNKDFKGRILNRTYNYVRVCGRCGANCGNENRTDG